MLESIEMEEVINQIKSEYILKIAGAKSLKDLDDYYLELFGKNGKVALLPREFSKLPNEELKNIGPLFNEVKFKLEKEIGAKRAQLKEEGYKKLGSESFSLEKVSVKKRKGHLHPITAFEVQIADLFNKIGFEQFEAPDIDTDYNNFEALNIPPEHPARDLWDTLYIDTYNLKEVKGKLLLRTHTSNSQIHIMEEFKPPIRKMNIGRCFRYENLDARHEHTFDQFELIYIDKGLSMANLQYLSEYFLKAMYSDDIKVRLTPGYYPFTEPSAHIWGECVFCKGKGCNICGEAGWLELAGAGMIHPTVLKNGGIDPKVYSGIAWGVGPGRMTMLKKGINDVRAFLSGDLKFLERY